MFSITYGSPNNLVEFLHADNFCQAHIKAAEAMEKEGSPVVCVRQYSLFIRIPLSLSLSSDWKCLLYL